jgi:signal transduction histidine kinase
MTEKNICYSSELLAILNNSESPDSLVNNIAKYYQGILPENLLIVVSPSVGIDPFQIIFVSGDEKKILKLFTAEISILTQISDLENHSIYALINHINRPDYLFYFGPGIEQIHSNIKNEFYLFNSFYYGLSACCINRQTENHNKYANLISHVTHDINSLLNLIDRTDINGSLENKIAYIERLLPQLLLFIREMELIRVSVNVDDLLSDIIEAHPDSDRICLANFDGDYTISCDIELINQAFSAILDNAIQASSETIEKIQISVDIRKKLPIFSQSSFLHIQIQDPGTGIPDEYIPLVSNPFFTTYKSAGHVGLGLSVARKIIDAHGGDLNISSKKNGGCIASVFLPLEMD